MVTIEDAIRIHVEAQGPVTFNSIYAYVAQQQTEVPILTRDAVHAVLAAMIRAEKVSIYDPEDTVKTYW